MKSIFDIRVQKLFLVVLVLKVTSSFLGWMLQDPWILGFTVPLLLMALYIVLGYFRRDSDVSDEKFADTCYYLGFIFTITSIIFSLFDLPNIGTRIHDIAVRFGAAMVSTVLGLGVRVYLVSFKKDVADAIKDAEEAVLDVTRKFTEQLTIALERLRDFESKVDNAARTSVERVNLQVENLSKNHADKLTEFFADLTNRNQAAFTAALADVKSASQRLAESVDGYSLGMRSNLASIEAKVGAFADAVTHRLETTTFPDEYFAEHLNAPLAQLKESSSALADGIRGSLKEVSDSTAVLSAALKRLRDKAGATEGSLDAVLKLTLQQQAVLDVATGQISALEQVGTTLKRVDEALAGTLASVTATNGAASELTTRITGVVADSVETRKALVADGAETRRTLETAFAGIVDTLKAQVLATNGVVATFEAGAAASKDAAQRLAGKLDASSAAAESASAALAAAATATSAAVGKLNAVAEADMKAAQALGALGQQATGALGRVDGAVEQLHGMVLQLAALDSTLRAHGSELKGISLRIQEARATATSPSTEPELISGFAQGRPLGSSRANATSAGLDGPNLLEDPTPLALGPVSGANTGLSGAGSSATGQVSSMASAPHPPGNRAGRTEFEGSTAPDSPQQWPPA